MGQKYRVPKNTRFGKHNITPATCGPQGVASTHSQLEALGSKETKLFARRLEALEGEREAAMAECRQLGELGIFLSFRRIFHILGLSFEGLS